MNPVSENSGRIIYDDNHGGHVCTCTETHQFHANGDPAPSHFVSTVSVDRSVEPTEGGSWFYRCSRCGAGRWSGL